MKALVDGQLFLSGNIVGTGVRSGPTHLHGAMGSARTCWDPVLGAKSVLLLLDLPHCPGVPGLSALLKPPSGSALPATILHLWQQVPQSCSQVPLKKLPSASRAPLQFKPVLSKGQLSEFQPVWG